MEYNEDDFLQLSGIQHFSYCKRQWALIHIEQQWAENFKTVDGELMHETAHDKEFNESRGDRVITRGMNIFSRSLGISGECDIVEFHKSDIGINITGYDGLWNLYPVEYKRGKPKENDCDKLQLCAQAMCLEEMLSCKIEKGALYYGEIRHRLEIEFTDELRTKVEKTLEEMHELFKRRYTPKVKYNKKCKLCSLNEICLPALMKNKSVSGYIRESMEKLNEKIT